MAAVFAVLTFPLTFFCSLSIVHTSPRCRLDWKGTYCCVEDKGFTGMPTLQKETSKKDSTNADRPSVIPEYELDSWFSGKDKA